MAAPPADRPPTAKRIENELTRIADARDRLDERKAALDAELVAWLEAGRAHRSGEYENGVSYRRLAEWARMTNPRVHQLVGPAAKSKAADAPAQSVS